jgi:hypothetical protein
MDDRDNPDTHLQARVAMLFRLWDDIRWIFRALPKPEKIGKAGIRWVTHPPTRNVVPRLITRAAMQPISAQERVMIMRGLTRWSDAYTQLVALSALPQDARTPELYSEATDALLECADELTRAVISLRRDMRRKRGQHGGRPSE